MLVYQRVPLKLEVFIGKSAIITGGFLARMYRFARIFFSYQLLLTFMNYMNLYDLYNYYQLLRRPGQKKKHINSYKQYN